MNIAIVGGGPAGLSAAAHLSAAGLPVTLIDEWDSLGGSARYARPRETWTGKVGALDQLRQASGVSVRTGTVAWGAFRIAGGIQLMLNHAGVASEITVDQVVLASGTTDVVQPVSGGTLAGVLTERALRILVNQHNVIPGSQIVIVGGSGSSRLAADIVHWQLAGVRITNVSLRMLTAIEGVGEVKAVRLRDGTAIPADTVVFAIGEAPDVQLAGMLGVPTVFDANRQGWFVPDSHPAADVWLCGGALLGAAGIEQVLQSAVDVVAGITGEVAK